MWAQGKSGVGWKRRGISELLRSRLGLLGHASRLWGARLFLWFVCMLGQAKCDMV